MTLLLHNTTVKKPRIGLTPLIDVVFILLIFFMLVMNFQRYQMQNIDVAQRAVVADEIDALTIEIINKNDCRFGLETRQCQLIEQLFPQQSTELVIRYQASSKLEDIIHWYQYFSSKYSTSLAVPLMDQPSDEN